MSPNVPISILELREIEPFPTESPPGYRDVPRRRRRRARGKSRAFCRLARGSWQDARSRVSNEQPFESALAGVVAIERRSGKIFGAAPAQQDLDLLLRLLERTLACARELHAALEVAQRVVQ